MPLPSVSTPKYELTVPSTKEVVKFRPFLVKEEKILLMASESKDQKQVVNALRDVLAGCITSENKLDVMTLPTFDLQYIFLKLRAKSVGEVSELTVLCPKCESVSPAEIDLGDVEVTFPEGHAKEIPITDEVGLVMRYPTFEMMESQSMCVDSIYDKDNIYTRKDYSDNDFKDFVYSLTQSDLTKMQQFFDTMPNMEHELKFMCTKCKEQQSVVLRSLDDFFTSDSAMSR